MPLRPAFPTMRLFTLAVLLGCIGIDTLFPVVGTGEVAKSASTAPAVGTGGKSSAPVVGTVQLPLSEGLTRFSGGFRRADGGNLQLPHAP